MTITITREEYDAFGGMLDARVAAFLDLKEAHKDTVGVPAPVEDWLVMQLAAGETYEVIDLVPASVPVDTLTPQFERLLVALVEGGILTPEIVETIRSYGDAE